MRLSGQRLIGMRPNGMRPNGMRPDGMRPNGMRLKGYGSRERGLKECGPTEWHRKEEPLPNCHHRRRSLAILGHAGPRWQIIYKVVSPSCFRSSLLSCPFSWRPLCHSFCPSVLSLNRATCPAHPRIPFLITSMIYHLDLSDGLWSHRVMPSMMRFILRCATDSSSMWAFFGAHVSLPYHHGLVTRIHCVPSSLCSYWPSCSSWCWPPCWTLPIPGAAFSNYNNYTVSNYVIKPPIVVTFHSWTMWLMWRCV